MPPKRRLLVELESHNECSPFPDKAALYEPAKGKRMRRQPDRFVANPANDDVSDRVSTRSTRVTLDNGKSKRAREKRENGDVQHPKKDRMVNEMESQKQQSRLRDLIELYARTKRRGKNSQPLGHICMDAKEATVEFRNKASVNIASNVENEEIHTPRDKSISSSINNNRGKEIEEGYKIRKAFTFWYDGQVVSAKPEWRHCNIENEDFEMWKVRYMDNDEEELTREQLEEYHANYVASVNPKLEGIPPASTTSTTPICTSRPDDIDCYNKAFTDLCNRVGFTQQEVKIVLSELKQPYCLDTAVQRIIKRKDDSGRAKHFQRRELHMLELFAGDAVVSEAFHRYSSFWRTRSIDNDPASRATDRVDFMKLKWSNIGTVPDFIWISPPCFNYSFLAGAKQRSPKHDQFAKSREALKQDQYLARISWFLEWAKKKKDHMIVVIENPVGWLSEMPKMKRIVEKMALHRTTVNNCAFGRKDKKPTNLWTNDLQLHAALNIFSKCSPEICPYYGKPHPLGAHKSCHDTPSRDRNPAAIPKLLADAVADSISAKFSINDLKIRYKAEPEVTQEDIAMFNRMMGCAE